MSDLQDLYQQVIIDHNHNPRNYRKIEHPTHSAKGHNPICGDKINVYLIVENDKIIDVSFIDASLKDKGSCAICRASSSLMTETLVGKTISEVETIFESVHDLLTKNESNTDDIGKLAVLSGVHKFPARVKCAMLSWRTLKNALENKDQTAITE